MSLLPARSLLLAAAAAALVGTVAMAPAAPAAPVQGQPLKKTATGAFVPVAKIMQPMAYEQVENVTENRSSITITLADGKTIEAPASLYSKVRGHMLAARHTKAPSAVKPDGSGDSNLCGDCGCSWVAIGYQNTASKPYLMNTGFTMSDFPAVSVDWWVHIYGPGGYAYEYTTGVRPLAEDWSWTGSHTATVANYGTWEAMVDTQSWAVDTTGGVCSSIGPSDVESL